METPPRTAIIGAGLMGRWHAAAAHRIGARIVSIADPDLDAAEALARRHRGARVYRHAEELLTGDGIDIVHVCSPSTTHADIIERAIDASVHALVEKPLTETAATAARLLQRATEQRVNICPVHQFLFQRGFLQAMRLLPQAGRLVALEVTVCSAGGSGVDGDLDMTIADIAVHPLYILHALSPVALDQLEWRVVRPDPGELRATAPAGTLSIGLFVSLASRPTECSAIIRGDAASIHLDFFHGYAVLEPGPVSRAQKIGRPFALSSRRLIAASANLARRTLSWEPAYPGLRALVRRFYAAAQAGEPPPIAVRDALAVARARDQLLESLSAGGSAVTSGTLGGLDDGTIGR